MYNILIFKVANIVINIDTANTGRLRLFLLQGIKKLMTSGEVMRKQTLAALTLLGVLALLE